MFWTALLIPLLFSQSVGKGLFDDYIKEKNKQRDEQNAENKKPGGTSPSPATDCGYCCRIDNNKLDWMILFKPREEEILVLIDGSNAKLPESKLLEEDAAKNPLYATLSWYNTRKTACDNEPKPDDPLYVIYNDALPNSVSVSTGGSSRGIFVYNDTSGFLMTHTVPGFPDLKKSYKDVWTNEMLSSAHLFICLSLDEALAKRIARELQYAGPLIYAGNVPKKEKTSEVGKPIDKLLAGNSERSSLGQRFFEVTVRKKKFYFLMKAGRTEYDLTGDFLAKNFSDSFTVFTGVPLRKRDRKLPSKCRVGLKVENFGDVVTVNKKYSLTPYQNDFSWSCSIHSGRFCLLSQGRTVRDRSKHGMAICVQSDKARKAFCQITDSNVERC